MGYKFYDCKVTDIIDETDDVKRFFFECPKDIDFSFSAGQFVMLLLPIDAKIKHRSYSIASPPSDNNKFELIIVLNPKGLGTPWMWDNLKPGSVIPVSRPIGKFLLPESIDRDICFICTGVGIAPFRSQLWDIFNRAIPHRNLYMVFGTRYEKDILYRNEMNLLQQEHPEFHFIPTLSRENSENWKGRKGYVHHVYEELFADRRDAYFYICGWKDMLNEARKRIADMGYDKKFIKFEVYD